MFDNWSQVKNGVTLNDLLAFTKAANIRPYRWRLRVLHNTFNMEVVYLPMQLSAHEVFPIILTVFIDS